MEFVNASPTTKADEKAGGGTGSSSSSKNDIAVYLYRNGDPIFTKPGVIANEDPINIDYTTLVIDDTELDDTVQVVFADYPTATDQDTHPKHCNWLTHSNASTCFDERQRKAFCFNMFFDTCVTYAFQAQPPQDEMGEPNCNIPIFACPNAAPGVLANLTNKPLPKYPCPAIPGGGETKQGYAWGILWRECASNFAGPLLGGLNLQPPWRYEKMNFNFSGSTETDGLGNSWPAGACDFLRTYYTTSADNVAAEQCETARFTHQGLGRIDVAFPKAEDASGAVLLAWDQATYGNKNAWSETQTKAIDQGGTASYRLQFWATRCACGEYVTAEGYCAACAPGERCPDGFGAGPCGAGSSQAAARASACDACTPGFFQANTGKTACEPCPKGTVALNNSGVACAPCPSNQAAKDDGASCGGCAAGKAPSAADGGCVQCPAGTWSAADAAACSPCAAGRYAAAPAAADAPGQTTKECTGACDAGYYCPAGATSPDMKKCGHASLFCPAGSGAPRVCQAGSYTTSCVSEDSGSGVITPGKGGCTPQDKATDPANIRQACVPCDPGHGCRNGVKKACDDYGENAAAGGSRCAGDADRFVPKAWRSWAIASWSLLGTMSAVLCFRRVRKLDPHRRESDDRRSGRSSLASPSEDSLQGIQMRENPLSRGTRSGV